MCLECDEIFTQWPDDKVKISFHEVGGENLEYSSIAVVGCEKHRALTIALLKLGQHYAGAIWNDMPPPRPEERDVSSIPAPSKWFRYDMPM